MISRNSWDTVKSWGRMWCLQEQTLVGSLCLRVAEAGQSLLTRRGFGVELACEYDTGPAGTPRQVLGVVEYLLCSGN